MTRALVFLAALLAGQAAMAADFMLTATRPNHLHLIDLAARKVVRTYPLPGKGVPGSITTADDGKVAYVMTNHSEIIVGIDLDSGKQVFQADMSTPQERVKSMFGLTVTRDGSKLYVYQIPARIGRNEYESLATRIAVYNTADGLNAKPVKTFLAPRRISVLAPTSNPDRVVGMGEDIYVFDAKAGKVDRTHPLRHWQRKGVGEPDILLMWHQYEQARVVSSPYYVPNTDADPASPEAFKIGIMNFDLDTEQLSYAEVANADTGVFSAVVNPAKRNEVFAVMNQIFRIDMEQKKFVERRDLDNTFYAVNISSDGKELYVGGAVHKVVVYDTATLTRQGEIVMPGDADQGAASIRVIRR
jgi:quinohemoprotein amine dehydrogenase beta subunit